MEILFNSPQMGQKLSLVVAQTSESQMSIQIHGKCMPMDGFTILTARMALLGSHLSFVKISIQEQPI